MNSCTVDGGCRFDIEVANLSSKSVSGPFVIEDVVTVDGAFIGSTAIESTENSPGSKWQCAKRA
ncbi:MAG: hypothetical protein IPL91_14870 [Hyphomicrobium sp.]|nr:hypothetical protein [Hyphomicrobium sp.]